jgi:hypothetical protein
MSMGSRSLALPCVTAWTWMRMVVKLNATIITRLKPCVDCGCCGLKPAVDGCRSRVFILSVSPFLAGRVLRGSPSGLLDLGRRSPFLESFNRAEKSRPGVDRT